MTDATPTPTARLNEHDQEEWWDIARQVNPNVSRETFEADWNEFVLIKVQHELKALS